MKKILHAIVNRLTLVILLLVIQFSVLAFLIWKLSTSFTYIYALFILLSVLVSIDVLINDMNPSFKLSWCIFIFLVPVFGGLFYVLCAKLKPPKKSRNAQQENKALFSTLYPKNNEIIEELEKNNKAISTQSRYIQKSAGMPVYKNTATKYYPLGEDFFEALLLELRKAEKYIFLEYFILADGVMWKAILEILKEKAGTGVDVRVIYDDAGSINLIPDNYDKVLEGHGIKAVAFNPFIPALSIFIQNRDHRKIAVIDGHTAFTGGINIGDEYINAYEKHGHWKDSAVMLKGAGVYSMTLMFLSNWRFHRNDDADFERYRPDMTALPQLEAGGYVQPYGDSPYDNEEIGESVYLNIFNNTTDYLYICTPYLIVDNEVINSLILAAKKGVDVRILTPGIADKAYVHFTSRSYYSQLIRGGVRIYEYTPGFIHSKTVVADDSVATVGTVNLDYRSLYHHFECGVFMYDTEAVLQMKEDFIETLEVCTEITREACSRQSLFRRIGQALMRIVAPLM